MPLVGMRGLSHAANHSGRLYTRPPTKVATGKSAALPDTAMSSGDCGSLTVVALAKADTRSCTASVPVDVPRLDLGAQLAELENAFQALPKAEVPGISGRGPADNKALGNPLEAFDVPRWPGAPKQSATSSEAVPRATSAADAESLGDAVPMEEPPGINNSKQGSTDAISRGVAGAVVLDTGGGDGHADMNRGGVAEPAPSPGFPSKGLHGLSDDRPFPAPKMVPSTIARVLGRRASLTPPDPFALRKVIRTTSSASRLGLPQRFSRQIPVNWTHERAGFVGFKHTILLQNQHAYCRLVRIRGTV
jgi:hypothetical protein